MTHSVLITIVAAGLCLAMLCGATPSASLMVLCLCLGVVIVGMPHGALDHRVAISMAQDRQRVPSTKFWFLAAFFLAYVGVAMGVLAGWFIAPQLTVLMFFVVSAWHFGLEDCGKRESLGWIDHLRLATRGGMVIWIPALCRGPEMARVLDAILPVGLVSGEVIVASVRILAVPLIALALWDVRHVFRTESTRWIRWSHLSRIVSFALMFACVPILLSFAIYFCGWHSIRGLADLRQKYNGSFYEFCRSLLPISLVAFGLLILGFGFFWRGDNVSQAAVQSTFIGLSAVAVPHLLLHVSEDVLRSTYGEEKTFVPAMSETNS